MLIVSDEATEGLDRLYAATRDRRWHHLLDRVEYWLDRLDTAPGSADVRQHRLQPPGVWMIRILAPEGADWIILWLEQGPDIHVTYIGAASFA